MDIVQLTVSRPLYSRYQITYQGNGSVLGVLVVIIKSTVDLFFKCLKNVVDNELKLKSQAA